MSPFGAPWLALIREQAGRNLPERSRLLALQGAFKILINSLYGYLAFPFGHFADFEAAERVTAIGREILATMRDWLMSQGAQIIELDPTASILVRPMA